MSTKSYSSTAFIKNKGIFCKRLKNEISISLPTIIDVVYNKFNVILTFSNNLSVENINTLNTIISNHPNNSILPPFTHNINPSINDDINNGYFTGDYWINYSTKRIWRCINDYPNNAEWILENRQLSELIDTNISSLNLNDVLLYNSNNSKWENKSIKGYIVDSQEKILKNAFVLSSTSAIIPNLSLITNTQKILNLKYYINFQATLRSSGTSTYSVLFNINNIDEIDSEIILSLRSSSNDIICNINHVITLETNINIQVKLKRLSGSSSLTVNTNLAPYNTNMLLTIVGYKI